MNSIDLLLFILLCAIVFFGCYTAYRNGVRDGYQNTFLDSVKRQVESEGLEQGDKVE